MQLINFEHEMEEVEVGLLPKQYDYYKMIELIYLIIFSRFHVLSLNLNNRLIRSNILSTLLALFGPET